MQGYTCGQHLLILPLLGWARVCPRASFVAFGPRGTCDGHGAWPILVRIRDARAALRRRAETSGFAPAVRAKVMQVIEKIQFLTRDDSTLLTESWVCVPFGCEGPSRNAILELHSRAIAKAVTGLPYAYWNPWSETEVAVEFKGNRSFRWKGRRSHLRAPVATTSRVLSCRRNATGCEREHDGRLRAAFCISGLPRGFSRRGIHHSMKRNLIDAFGAPISRVFWRVKREEPPRSGVALPKIVADEEEFSVARNELQPVVWESRADVRADPPEYVARGCKRSRIWRQMKVMAECFDLVKAYEQEHGTFDVVFRIRTDSLFVRRFPHHTELLNQTGGLEQTIVVRDQFIMAPRRFAEVLMDLTPFWEPVDTWGMEIILLEAIREHGISIGYQCVRSACKHDWWIPVGEPQFQKKRCLDFLVIVRGGGDIDAWNKSQGSPPISACQEDAASKPRHGCWAYPNFAYVPEEELRIAATSSPEVSPQVDSLIEAWHQKPACGKCADFADLAPQSRSAIQSCELFQM